MIKNMLMLPDKKNEEGNKELSTKSLAWMKPNDLIKGDPLR
jgi:hypothetical protein